MLMGLKYKKKKVENYFLFRQSARKLFFFILNQFSYGILCYVYIWHQIINFPVDAFLAVINTMPIKLRK